MSSESLNSLEIQTNLPKKRKKSRKGMFTVPVNLNKVHHRLLNILNRDVVHLMESSFKGVLTKDQSASLVNYLKLIKTLKELEKEKLSEMSEEDLEKLVESEKSSPETE